MSNATAHVKYNGLGCDAAVFLLAHAERTIRTDKACVYAFALI